jgi:hypothetical protein
VFEGQLVVMQRNRHAARERRVVLADQYHPKIPFVHEERKLGDVSAKLAEALITVLA